MPTYQQRFGHAPHPQIVTPPRKKSMVAQHLSGPPLAVHDPTAPGGYRRVPRSPGEAAAARVGREQRAKIAADNARRSPQPKVVKLGFDVGAGLHGVRKIAGDLSTAAYSWPGGVLAAGTAVGRDVAASQRGDLSFKRSRKMGTAMLKQTYADLRHPSRHPGFAALDLFALASAGAGGAARAGAAGRALSEGAGVRAALARPGFQGGSLLHAKTPGEIPLPGGAQALEYENPLLRRLQHSQAAKTYRARPGVIGRELRAREKVQTDIAGAPIEAARARLKKLTPAENTAMRVLAVEGKHALAHPEETIQRHIDTHLRYAEQGKDPVMNREVAADLAKALPVLKNPPRHWLEAAAATRRVGRQSERELIAGDRLTQAGAQERLAKIAGEYGRNTRQVTEPKLFEAFKDEHGYWGVRNATTGKPLHMSAFPGDDMKPWAESLAKRTTKATPADARSVAPKGSFYFPTGEKFKVPSRPVKTGAASRKPSGFGLGPPQASQYLGGTMRRFTGKGLARGVVQKPGEAIASRAAGTQRLASAERYHSALKQLATPERVSENQIEIRAGKITSEQRRRVGAAIEEAATGNQTALVRATNQIKETLAPVPGERSIWVDKRYIKEFANPSGSKLASAASAFNRPFRFGGVYARPAYVFTNRPQNYIMRKLAQGVRSRKQMHGRVGTLRSKLGPELSAKIDAAAGETRTESYNPQAGKIGQGEKFVTEQIMKATDASERFLSVLKQAHNKGYTTERDLRHLFSSGAKGKVLDDQIAVSRRARKDLVDFSSLTPAEREFSDIVYFYPWLSRGSAWAGRFVAQHPVKAAALASFAPTGAAEERKALGAVPSWMKGYIPSRFGVSNPASLNTFETPAQIAQTLATPTGPQARSFGEEFGTPIVQAITTKPSELPKRAVQSLAPGAALTRAGLIGKPPKTFPETGAAPALGPFLFGGMYPRKVDKAVVAKQAQAALSPEERLAQTRTTQLTHLQNLVKKGELPRQKIPEMRKALDIYNQRQLTNSKIGKATSPGTDREKQKMVALLSLLQKNGLLSAQKQKEYQRYYTTKPLSAAELQKDRAWFWETTAGPTISWYRKKAGAH